MVTEPCEFTSFCFPFLFSSRWFILLARPLHFQLQVFLSASATPGSLPTTLRHTEAVFLPREQRLFKCPPMSFKIACAVFCILSISSHPELWWRYMKGSEFLHQCYGEVALSYIPRRIHSHAITRSCWVQIKTSKQFHECWLVSVLSVGWFWCLRSANFSWSFPFCGCVVKQVCFLCCSLLPNETWICAQPFFGEDIDSGALSLLPQCLFSQNL